MGELKHSGSDQEQAQQTVCQPYAFAVAVPLSASVCIPWDTHGKSSFPRAAQVLPTTVLILSLSTGKGGHGAVFTFPYHNGNAFPKSVL